MGPNSTNGISNSRGGMRKKLSLSYHKIMNKTRITGLSVKAKPKYPVLAKATMSGFEILSDAVCVI